MIQGQLTTRSTPISLLQWYVSRQSSHTIAPFLFLFRSRVFWLFVHRLHWLLIGLSAPTKKLDWFKDTAYPLCLSNKVVYFPTRTLLSSYDSQKTMHALQMTGSEPVYVFKNQHQLHDDYFFLHPNGVQNVLFLSSQPPFHWPLKKTNQVETFYSITISTRL